MKDLMTIWNDEGGKEKLTKHYMNMFLKEVFFLCQEEYAETENKVSFSIFASLRSEIVLLMNDSLKDQCKCKIYENFLLKLDAMGNK